MSKVKKSLEEIWTDYPGRPRFTMLDVYNLIKKHSRLIDRLNPMKMAEMTLTSWDIHAGIANNIPDRKNWKFYDKDVDLYKSPDVKLEDHTVNT